jgi:hypothetical protein
MLIKALVRAAYETLGLQTFYTSGPTETRAWTIVKGVSAPQVSFFLDLSAKLVYLTPSSLVIRLPVSFIVTLNEDSLERRQCLATI